MLAVQCPDLREQDAEQAEAGAQSPAGLRILRMETGRFYNHSIFPSQEVAGAQPKGDTLE